MVMAEFRIFDHLDKLKPDGGRDSPNGDRSYKCPACGAENFKVNHRTGKWDNYSCGCSKPEIRNAINPAINPNKKGFRPPQTREWIYRDRAGSAVIKVCRSDDGAGGKRIWQKELINGKRPAELAPLAVPYRLHDALEELKNGASVVFWVEGETCADALWELGLPAVTSIGGAGKFKPERDAGHIPPDRLVVVPDRDKPGVHHAEQVAAAHPGCKWLYPFPGTAQWNGGCPEKGGLDVVDWIQLQGATVEDIFDGIGDKFDPNEQQEAVEVELEDFLKQGQSLKDRLDAGLDKIDAISNVATRSACLHTLQHELGLNQKSFGALVTALAEAKEPQVSESFDDLMNQDEGEKPALVEDLFGSGLVLIAAEGHAGKTSAAYQLAEAVTNGSKFADQFQCEQAPVLMIQKDESDKDAKVKWRRMGLTPAKRAFTIKWKFSPMMFPELRSWVAETGAKLVILDSLMTIAGGSISPKDAEFGLLIYRLNGLAGELGITILCLHHVVKRGDAKRVEISKDDIYGTAYVYNGASDAWGLWRTTEDGTGDALFSLRCLKARSGLVDIGTTYQFIGNDEDRRMFFKGMADRTITLNEIRSARGKIQAYLERAGGSKFRPAELMRILNLGSTKYAAKLCAELYDRRSASGIDRKRVASTGGRPGYAYFSVRQNAQIEVEKKKSPEVDP